MNRKRFPFGWDASFQSGERTEMIDENTGRFNMLYEI